MVKEKVKDRKKKSREDWYCSRKGSRNWENRKK